MRGTVALGRPKTDRFPLQRTVALDRPVIARNQPCSIVERAELGTAHIKKFYPHLKPWKSLDKPHPLWYAEPAKKQKTQWFRGGKYRVI